MKKRRGWRWSGTSLALAIAAAACKPPPGPGDAGTARQLSSVDAGQPRVVLQLRIEVEQPDGGLVRESLGPAPGPLLPVTQALDVTTNLPLRNYRLRILDEVDRALASDDKPEETLSGLRYHIQLVSPLRSGHRYAVLLDAQTGAALDDGSGGRLDEQRFDFHTEGEREREAQTKRSSSKHHHRRNDGP